MSDDYSRFETRFLGGGVKRAGQPPWLKQQRKWRPTEKRKHYQKLYQSKWWRETRERLLAENPICAYCKVRLASQVNHRVPHRGSEALFYCDDAGLAVCCKPCHDRISGRGR